MDHPKDQPLCLVLDSQGNLGGKTVVLFSRRRRSLGTDVALTSKPQSKLLALDWVVRIVMNK